MVMIRMAGLRPRFDQLKLLITGVLVATLFVAVIALNDFMSAKYRINLGKYVPSREAFYFYFWITGVCLAAAYFLARVLVGVDRADDLFANAVERAVHIYKRSRK